MLHFLPVAVPNEPERSDQSQQRHDVRSQAGDDGMRHGINPLVGGAFDTGSSRKSLPPLVASDTVTTRHAIATLIGDRELRSSNQMDAAPVTAIDRETCPSCRGSGRGHWRACSVCGGSGRVP